MTCSVEGCERPATCRRMCKMHYQRWRKTGDPGSATSRRPPDDATARFWFYTVVSEDCWLWVGPTTRRHPKAEPYGVLRRRGMRWQAHRFAYELLVGPVPAGMHLHHRCEHTLCVNPAHLEPKPPMEHLRLHLPATTAKRLAKFAAQPACRRGHLKAEHGYHDGRQWACRECQRQRHRRYRARRTNPPA